MKNKLLSVLFIFLKLPCVQCKEFCHFTLTVKMYIISFIIISSPVIHAASSHFIYELGILPMTLKPQSHSLSETQLDRPAWSGHTQVPLLSEKERPSGQVSWLLWPPVQ